MTRSQHASSGRLDGDGGAVIVEFALVLPLLALMFLGIVDFGNAYRYRNTLESSLTTAARTGSQLSRNRFADYELLRSLSSGLDVVGSPKLAIVWKANSTNEVPPACLGISAVGVGKKGIPGVCNVYSKEQIETSNPVGFPAGASTNPLTPPQNQPPAATPPCPSASWDANWCSWQRNNFIGSGDYLGLHVEMEYTPITGITGSAVITMTESTIYRLEPPFVGG